MIRKIIMLAMAAILLSGCDAFDIHPYNVHVKGERDINARHIQAIEQQCEGKDTLRVAFISDTHNWYADTKDEINDLNQHPEVDFVVHLGDLTDTGTIKEYEWIRNILGGLQRPYVALIGNHDFLGTGDQNYKVMFGQMDFCFIAGGIKFLCLNTNATEYDYMAAVPNFDYIEQEITADSTRFDRTVVLMHADPYSDQFNNNVAKAFNRYIQLLPGLVCCVNGHGHALDEQDFFGNGIIYYQVPCPENRQYLIFTFTRDGYEHKVVDF